MSTEITETKGRHVAVTPQAKIRDLLTRQKDQIARALPKFMTSERFVRIALTTINKNPKLLECTETSLMGCIMDCAQLGLEPDNVMGRAYLIPFNDKRNNRVICTLIVGYKGLCDLAYRSGKVKSLMAQIVCEKDKFDFQFGLNHRLDHVPYFGEEDRGPVVAVYAYAIMENGVTAFDVMGVDDVEKIKKRSKSSDNGPWVTDWDEMARKTVLKRLAKYLPLSSEFMDAVNRDNESEEEEKLKAAKVVLPVSTPAPALPAPEEHIPMPEKTQEAEPVAVTVASVVEKTVPANRHAPDAVPEQILASLMAEDGITADELAVALKSFNLAVPRGFKGPSDLRDDVLADAIKNWSEYKGSILAERKP